jgi:hypothetical protein
MTWPVVAAARMAAAAPLAALALLRIGDALFFRDGQ